MIFSLRFDYSKLLNKLKSDKFIRVRTVPGSHSKIKLRGAFKGNLVNLNHQDILRFYNAKMRGSYNYYCVFGTISSLSYILCLRCAC